MRLSLAGAQQKLPVYYDGKRLHLPLGGASSHVLKPAPAQFPGLVENETFCMMLAKRYGLPVPHAFILKGATPVYMVERYDRERDAAGKLYRVHQEDFCQALGYRHSMKYESEGGPSLSKCFELLKSSGTVPIVDVGRLLKWTVFNAVVGNCDAHAKNISMLIRGKDYRLAPFYDLVCTSAYPGLDRKLAMNIGDHARPGRLRRRNWEALSDWAGVSRQMAVQTCREMCEAMPDTAKKAHSDFEAQYGKSEMADTVRKKVNFLAKKILFGIRAGRRHVQPPR